MRRSDKNKIEIAYLVELKPPVRSIDISKIQELRIPGGPHMRLLKSGQEVTLPDGRLIKPEDVLRAPQETPDPSCLIVECSSVDRISSLQNNTLLQSYVNGQKVMKYVVHFTEKSVISTDSYQSWMSSFGAECEHLIVNGTGPHMPHMEPCYRINAILSYISPKHFPCIHPLNFNGTIHQDDECHKKGNFLFVRPFQRFFLRKPATTETNQPNVSLNRTDLLLQLKEEVEISEAISKYAKDVDNSQENNDWPRMTFLGTSSAVPTSYRNVSSYLLQFASNSWLMVDCGEGTYGQLRTFFGDGTIDEVLVNLRAIFLTHGHQDHFHGIFTLTMRRKEAFEKKGVPYEPIVLLSGRHIFRVLREVDRSFDNYSQYINIIDIWKLMCDTEKKELDFLSIPKDVMCLEDIGVKSVTAVKVNHSRNALGYVFTKCDGRKIVFSGDTMPCDRLVEQGMDAEVLVHESTFADGEEAHAVFKKHSTMKQACDIASKMRAKHLILTHFSAKYPKVPPLPDYLDAAGNVTIAMDNMTVTPNNLSSTAKLIPVYRAVFSKELTEIKQRNLRKRVYDDELSILYPDTFNSKTSKLNEFDDSIASVES